MEEMLFPEFFFFLTLLKVHKDQENGKFSELSWLNVTEGHKKMKTKVIDLMFKSWQTFGFWVHYSTNMLLSSPEGLKGEWAMRENKEKG